jgi:hypothetical protein
MPVVNLRALIKLPLKESGKRESTKRVFYEYSRMITS